LNIELKTEEARVGDLLYFWNHGKPCGMVYKRIVELPKRWDEKGYFIIMESEYKQKTAKVLVKDAKNATRTEEAHKKFIEEERLAKEQAEKEKALRESLKAQILSK
jgi:hypothetical protein